MRIKFIMRKDRYTMCEYINAKTIQRSETKSLKNLSTNDNSHLTNCKINFIKFNIQLISHESDNINRIRSGGAVG